MRSTFIGIRPSQPAKYRIRLQGRLSEGWSDWFDDLAVTIKKTSTGATVTILTGIVQDQAALHGVLNRIRDLNIPLLSVDYLHLINE